ILHSSFFILHSQFFILHSQFFILHSSFFMLLPFQNFLHLLGQCGRSEWFLEERHIGIENPVPDDGIIGVTAHKQDF
ncbi:MAG TPA: hypothetical protein PL157_09480, partial [Acidobacteriota bacterium]|nr:hypothetical protein [Acidobacteriota bacterium]